MTTAEHQEYPKYMTHPMHQPSKMEKIQTVYPGGKVVEDTKGTAERFPPVMVNNADQEGIHAAQGYVAGGKSDPETFKRLVQAGASSPGGGAYTPAEFPKWVNGVLCDDEAQEQAAMPLVMAEPRDNDLVRAACGGLIDEVSTTSAESDPRDDLITEMRQQIAEMRDSIAAFKAANAIAKAEGASPTPPAPLPVTQTPDLTRHRGRPRKASQ